MIDDRCEVCGAMGGYGLGASIAGMRWYCRACRPDGWFAIEAAQKKETPETRASVGSWEETRSTAEPQTVQPSLLWDEF